MTLERHPRNPHGPRYDLRALIRAYPDLARFVVKHPRGGDTVDFTDPESVLALNRALLMRYHGIERWSIPPGYLCPPVPGRAEYLHHAADLLAVNGKIPCGPDVRVLDIGAGANCIYPILGVSAFDWSFVGTEIDAEAVAWARTLIADNRILAGRVEYRLQRSAVDVFNGVTRRGESFALSLCNPPFHASRAEAEEGTRRKWRNLRDPRPPKHHLNFGGRDTELWCKGGEVGFITRMIEQSAARPTLCRWFTTLVSKSGHLPAIRDALASAGATEVRVVEMAYGEKKSRFVAWTFGGAGRKRAGSLTPD